MKRKWQLQVCGAMGMGLLALAGCQTWVPAAGVTLPSGRYLQHPPQYIPPDPDFPLTKELSAMQGAQPDQAGAPAPAAMPAVPER